MKFHVCTVQLLSLYFMCSIRCALFQVLKIQEIMKYMEFMCVPFERSTCHTLMLCYSCVLCYIYLYGRVILCVFCYARCVVFRHVVI